MIKRVLPALAALCLCLCLSLTLTALCLPLTLTARDKPFLIEGKIHADTLTSGVIILQYEHENGKAERDTAFLKDNTYQLRGNIEDEGAVRVNLFLYSDVHTKTFKGFAQFFAVPGVIEVSHQPNFGTFTVSGSPAQADNELLAKASRGADQAVIQRAFIHQHPGSWVSYVTLVGLFNYLKPDTAAALYAALSPGLKKYPEVALFGKRIKGMGVAAIGTLAPDFAESDSNGRSVSLSSYRGKYVLLTFWASWCHGCRAENRFLVPAYNKYKDKGFEILGVSLDGGPIGKQLWLKAVAQDKTAWTQISDLKGGNNVAAIQYGVSAIPRNFLIDPNGIVIARDLDEGPLNQKLEKLYGGTNASAGAAGATATASTGTFHLSGKIRSDSLIGGYIYMSYHPKGTLATDIRDSALLTDNTYHFEGHMTDGAVRVVIHWNRRPMKLDTGRNQLRSMAVWVGDGDHASVEHTADFHDIHITGSPVQAQLDSLSHALSLRQRPPDKTIGDFIRSHPDSWISYIALDQMFRGHMVHPDTSVELYGRLSPSLRQFSYVKQLGDNINLSAGHGDTNAKELTLDDADGKPVSLSSLRGKYVLLDFWASWCGPCREENPNLLKAYDTYKGKNFTILSVSMDKSKDAWLQAVSQDHLPWTQVSDRKAFDSPVAQAYKVSALPTNFLIDPAGKIIATNLRGILLNNKLAEILH
jgi:peroxiredoxin